MEDEQLSVTVPENGKGIRDEDQLSVFELFTQGDSSCTRIYEGIGVGLALVRKITELLKGRMTLESRLGYGSSFSAIFPFPAIACPYVPARIKERRYQAMLLFTPAIHNARTAKMFADFYGFELVTESEFDPNRLALICLDNSDQQKSRALQISALSSRSLIRLILSDDDGDDLITQSFSTISSSSWILRASSIFRRAVTSGNECTSCDIDWIPPCSTLHVLVVAGDATDEFVLRKILEKIECTCVIASAGNEGLTQLSEGSFDVAFVDRQVPLMNGQTIGETLIRDRDTYGRIPWVTAVDTVWSQADIEWCKRNGLLYILTKPFTVKSVSYMLHQAAGK
jgi:CheY-like chemotaxis protein